MVQNMENFKLEVAGFVVSRSLVIYIAARDSKF